MNRLLALTRILFCGMGFAFGILYEKVSRWTNLDSWAVFVAITLACLFVYWVLSITLEQLFMKAQ